MTEEASDAELVARARAGETEAFGLLYQRYFDPIYRYLRARVPEASDAEDLAATVFLQAYQSLPRYREMGWPFSAFLYRLARNATADHYRRRRDIAIENADEISAPGISPDEAVDHRQNLAALRKALMGLSPDYQEVIRLRLLLDLPTATVAQWMGRSKGAVRVLLYRALEALRRTLDVER